MNFRELVVRAAPTARRTVAEFDRDYPTLLVSLASSVRTGLDPISAMKEACKLFPKESVMALQLNAFSTSLSQGDQLDRALGRFAADVRHPDVPLLLSALKLADGHGAPIGETLGRLARVTRQRQSFRRKVRAALAMQKLSVLGIALSALAVCGIQLVGSGDMLANAWNHPLGRKCLSFGTALSFVGVFWMYRIGGEID